MKTSCARIVGALLFPFLLSIPKLLTQDRIQDSNVAIIQVHADQSDGLFPPVWNYFGYDEPNYTYAPNGRKLLGEISALGRTPAYIRVHNILSSGDGSASLKWGSTDVYNEDAAGNPVYDWKIVDGIFGYWQGTAEEYFKLHDYSAEAISKALPEAQFGGPDSTGPGNAKSAQFLRDFLQHCAHGAVHLKFELARQGLSLVRMGWQ